MQAFCSYEADSPVEESWKCKSGFLRLGILIKKNPHHTLGLIIRRDLGRRIKRDLVNPISRLVLPAAMGWGWSECALGTDREKK